MKLKDLPIEEMPRERLLKYGVKNISNEDLIAIILNTGTKEISVKELSANILKNVSNIKNLDDICINELTSIKGLGKVKAIKLLASIELGKRVSTLDLTEKILLNNSSKVNSYFSPLISSSKQEELLVVLLNNAKRLISYNKMFKGSDAASIVSIKEILNYAIRQRASGIIIMHNHPSGNLVPSKQDDELTNNLNNASKIMGIPLLDHIITSGKNYYSYLEGKIINES